LSSIPSIAGQAAKVLVDDSGSKQTNTNRTQNQQNTKSTEHKINKHDTEPFSTTTAEPSD
jgi:hypothetical protein